MFGSGDRSVDDIILIENAKFVANGKVRNDIERLATLHRVESSNFDTERLHPRFSRNNLGSRKPSSLLS